MSRPVTILAPAPVRHVPARSRQARTSYAPVDVTVEIRELSRTEAPRGPDLPMVSKRRLCTRLVDGEAWRPLGCDDAFAESGKPGFGNPPDWALFSGWLEGREWAAGIDQTDLGRCFEGTPLLARVPGQRVPGRAEPSWNASRQGALLSDGREDAPRRVREYVEGNVALVDGVPFQRMPGPLVYLDSATVGGERRNVRIVRHPGAWTTNNALSMANLHRHDRIGELRAAMPKDPGELFPEFEAAALAGLRMREDDDVEVMLRDSLRILATGVPPINHGLDLRRVEDLMALSALASVSAIEPSGQLPAWEFARDLARDVAAPGGQAWIVREAARIARYADVVALPRLLDRVPASEEDLASLAGL